MEKECNKIPEKGVDCHMNNACAECKVPNDKRICRDPNGIAPAGCTTAQNRETLARAHEEYEREDIRLFAQMAARQEVSGYRVENGMRHPIKPRMTEVVEFCKRIGYHRLGLAFCAGLRAEAAIVENILCHHGFEVVSAICKVGGEDKIALGLSESEKINPGKYESMCNPIAQAMILNELHTDFNILLGLCVGHDSLFLKYADAMCTVLAVKDRMLGHNPLACIYTAGSYFNYMLRETP